MRYLQIIIIALLPLNCFAKEQNCNSLAETVMVGLSNNNLTIQQFETAKEVCTAQALEGNSEAQYHVGGLNTVHVQNVYPNRAEMWKWMNLSAENGYAKAQSFLGRSYETTNNYLRKKDINLAIKWHTLAAEQNDIASMVRLEEIYRKGLLGLKTDQQKAKFWANKLQNI